jgi:hypothetical protein
MNKIESLLLEQTNREDAIRCISESFDFVEVINNTYKEYDEANKKN